jgi:hypothetical protein
MLDEATHFFDGWNVHTLEDDWNEAYGQYILQIDEPRSAAGYDELNRNLPDVDVDVEEPRPPRPPGGPQGGEIAKKIYACAVCYSEVNIDNWWVIRPCKHCFCEACVRTVYPIKEPTESYGTWLLRCQACPTCRGDIIEVEKIFLNFVILDAVDLVLPVVHVDDNDVAEGAASAAAAALEEELEDDGAASRRLENQRIVSDLMHSERHRGTAMPNHQWDTLDDEIGLEDFDLSQPNTSSQRSLPAIGHARTKPAPKRGKGSRGRRGGSQPPRDRASQVKMLDRRAQSILKTTKGKQPIGKKYYHYKFECTRNARFLVLFM